MDTAALNDKRLSQLTPAEMRVVISALKPKADMRVGIDVLCDLLDQSGTQAVVAFVEKMHRILDKEGRLYEYDFTEAEKRLLKGRHSQVLLNRRQALTNIGYGLGGATLVALGGFELGDRVTGNAPPSPPQPHGRRNFLTGAKRVVRDWAVPIFAEVGIGAALMNEVVKDWREMKLEHVANAVAELAERLEQKPSPAR